MIDKAKQANLKEINNQLINTLAHLLIRDRILERMATVEAELTLAQEKLPQLITKAAQESSDIADIKQATDTRFLVNLLQSIYDWLTQEMTTAERAKRDVQNCEQTIDALEQQLKILTEELTNFIDISEGYRTLLHQQQILLSDATEKQRRDLLKISEKLATLRVNQQELNIAYEAGREAFAGVNKVVHILAKGKDSSGRWSVMTDSRGQKHDPISDAISHSLVVQPLLTSFQQALDSLDLNPFAHFDILTPRGSYAILFAFKKAQVGSENWITDLEVQPRIRRWFNQLEQLKSALRTANNGVKKELQANQKIANQLNVDRMHRIVKLSII